MTSASPSPIRHDTRAWTLQVWISFLVAVLLCGSGLAWLPGADLDRAFMVMGYVFCTSTAFAVAKTVLDNAARRVDTPMWGAVVWGGFAWAMALTGWGLWRMEVNPTWKVYLAVCCLFLIFSVVPIIWAFGLSLYGRNLINQPRFIAFRS